MLWNGGGGLALPRASHPHIPSDGLANFPYNVAVLWLKIGSVHFSGQACGLPGYDNRRHSVSLRPMMAYKHALDSGNRKFTYHHANKMVHFLRML